MTVITRIEIDLNEPQVAEAAVPLSKARPYIRDWDRTRYAAVFNKYGSGGGVDKFRIYVPSSAHTFAQKKVETPQWLIDHLATMGMTVDNYLAGTALMADGKRTVRIGKVLSKEPGMKARFDNDPQRRATKSVNTWVVISRHPYDIIGMSFDRGWTSCMDLKDGSNRNFLKQDVRHGTIVAYLVKDTDKNVNNPMARISIKPYQSKEGLILVPGDVYGVAPDSFQGIVNTFCRYMNSGQPTGAYKMPKELYPDGRSVEEIHVNDADAPLALTKAQREALAQSPTLSETVAMQLSVDSNFTTRYRLASNRAVTLPVLKNMFDSDLADDRILFEMALNPNADGYLLERMLVKGSYMVKENVSQHPNIAQETVDKVIMGEIKVDTDLIAHFADTCIPSVPVCASVVERVVADPNVEDTFTWMCADAILKSRRCSAPVARLFAQMFLDTPSLMETQDNLYLALLSNPALSGKDMTAFIGVRAMTKDDMLWASNNPNLSEDMIRYIAANVPWAFRGRTLEQLLANVNMPEDLALKIISDGLQDDDYYNNDPEYYTLMAVNNPRATAAVWQAVYEFSKGGQDKVDSMLIAHRNDANRIPLDALRWLAYNAPKLRINIAQYVSTPEELIISMIGLADTQRLGTMCMHTLERDKVSDDLHERCVNAMIENEDWTDLMEVGEAGKLSDSEAIRVVRVMSPSLIQFFIGRYEYGPDFYWAVLERADEATLLAMINKEGRNLVQGHEKFHLPQVIKDQLKNSNNTTVAKAAQEKF